MCYAITPESRYEPLCPDCPADLCPFKLKGILGNLRGFNEACCDQNAPELIQTVKVTTSRSVELRRNGAER